MTSRAELELIVSLKDEATRGLQSISNHVEGLGGQLARAGLMTGAAGIAAIGAAAAGAAVSGFGFNNTMEQVTAQLNAFTKDGEATAEILEMIRERAARTPFAFEEMASATAGLMPVARASGAALEDLVAQAEILAASNPAQGLEGAAFALREAAGGDFTSIIERFNLSRQTLNRLKEEGVPALEAVTIAMQEMGYDASLVSNMSETLSGRWSTLQDTLQGLAGVAMAPIFDRVSAALGQIGAYLSDGAVIAQIEALATSIGETLGGAFDWLIANGERVLPILTGIATALAAFTIISTVVGWIGGLVTAIGAFSAAATAAGGAVAAIVAFLGGPLTLVIAGIAAAIALLTVAWTQNWGGIQEKTAAVWGFLQGVFAALGEALGVVGNFFQTVLLPPIMAVWGFIESNLLPILTLISTFMAVEMAAAIGRLSSIWTDTLYPSLMLIWEFMNNTLVPLFRAVAEVVLAALSATVQNLSDMWNTVLYPALQRVGDFVGRVLEPGIVLLQIALSAAADIAGPYLTPILDALRGALHGAGGAAREGTSFVDGLRAVLSAMAAIIEGVINGLRRMADAIRSMPSLGDIIPDIPGFANGTNFAPGGLAWVGERGPELVELPRGSRVHTAEASRGMAGGITINLTVNGAGAGIAREVREAARMAVREALAEAGRRGDVRMRSA